MKDRWLLQEKAMRNRRTQHPARIPEEVLNMLEDPKL